MWMWGHKGETKYSWECSTQLGLRLRHASSSDHTGVEAHDKK